MKSDKEFLQGIYQKYQNAPKQKKIQRPMYWNKVASFILIGLLVGAVSFAGVKAYEYYTKGNLTPTFTGNSKIEKNAIWVGTFNLVWNEFMEERIHGPVQFENGNTPLVNELNKKTFTKDMLSKDSYYIKVAEAKENVKEEIADAIREKFNLTSSILEDFNYTPIPERSYILYAILHKQFTFLEPFDKIMYPDRFAGSAELVQYFGIVNSSEEELNKNIYVSFYNRDENSTSYFSNDFGVRLQTKEGEEVILYRTDNNNSFDQIYQEFLEKEKNYTGSREFLEPDEISIPYIHADANIRYDELCGKEIKGTNGLYILNAIQTVQFNLNEKGGNVTSEAGLQDIYLSISDTPRYFKFTDRFVLFLKEKDKEKPYFAMSVDDTSMLEVVDKLSEEEVKREDSLQSGENRTTVENVTIEVQ